MDRPETPLQRFRTRLYETGLALRQDALFELLDAVLSGDGPTSLVRHSLAAPFRRRWPSVCDALSDGSLDPAALRRLALETLPPPAAGERPLWVVDSSPWPRPKARTSPERTYGCAITGGKPTKCIVPAWEYLWLAAVPEPKGSWVLPLDVARRGPTAGPPTAQALEQLRRVLAARPAGAARPVVAFDGGFDPIAAARSDVPADRLVRLARNRVFYRAPGPYQGRGRPRIHGPAFRLQDPATHGATDHRATVANPDYGQLTVAAWEGLHARKGPDAPLTVVRVQVERLPGGASPPSPLWLAWCGAALPADLTEVARWYLRRFAVEHGFRFLKQGLGWTRIRPRSPAAADRWSWLLALALWQLWLARPLVADRRLPWETPRAPGRLTPGRVRRAFGGLFLGLGTPARPPRPRGKSPGRGRGARPGPAKRYPVVHRQPKRAA